MVEFSSTQENAYKSGIVRFYRGKSIVGAGFVTSGGYILSCAHVVEQSLEAADRADPVGKDVVVNFPFFSMQEKYCARILSCRVDGYDIAGVQLQQELPSGVTPIDLWPAYGFRHEFYVFGFPKGRRKGVGTSGQFLGSQIDGWVQMEATKTEGYAIEPGFSGSPVWDLTVGAVVGMTVARDKANADAKVAFMIPTRSLTPVLESLERSHLLELLECLDGLSEQVQQIYRLSLPQGCAEAIPDTLENKLKMLQTMPPQGTNYPWLIQFVGYWLLPQLGFQGDRESLKRWLSRQVEDIDSLLEHLGQRYDSQTLKSVQSSTSHLLIWVYEGSGLMVKEAIYIPNYDEYDAVKCLGAHKLVSHQSHQQVTMESLPGIINDCVAESSLIYPPIDLTIEMFLPFPQMNSAVDKWSTGGPWISQPLGIRHHVIVRSSERLEAVYNEFLNKWRQKWQYYQDNRSQSVTEVFVCGDETRPEQLLLALQQNHVIGLNLTEAPQNTDMNSAFGALLTSAVPMGVWLRQAVDEVGCPSTELTALLSCCVETLPNGIRCCRREALESGMADNAHIGHHLSFLYEDPKLLPPNHALVMS